MFNYAFTVDKELKIRSWNSGLEHFKKNNFKDVEGLPYFVVLPRLWNGETDAVAQVINNRQAVRIRNYQICCFYETGAIDLFIRPLFDGQTVNGAEIEISSYQGCILYHKLLRFQPLIDVGKVSMSLAHGVRNPLNAIKGAVVYLLEKYNEEPTLVEFTSIIEQEIEKLDSFITKFLSNSLIELEFLPTDINCLLKKIIALTTLQAALKNIAFVSELAE